MSIPTRYHVHQASQIDLPDIYNRFEDSLNGPLVVKDHLWRELGYSSSVALRMSVNQGTIPVVLMELPHRHGKFGLTEEIGRLLSQLIQYSQAPLE